MYRFDEDKGFEIPHPPLTNQHNNTINSFESGSIMSSDPNKYLPNLPSSYLPLHELSSFNPTFDTPSPSHNNCNIVNPLLSPSSSDDHPSLLFSKEQNEEQEIRRIKRMISNRESARRSRLRKRKQLDNLQSQVLQLLAANHQLAEKLNLVMESNYEILQENARLREEAICLRNELLMSSMKCDLQEEDNGACTHDIRANNNAQTMISTSPNSITSSMDVLH